jgi:hypothetical protein
VGHGDYNHVAQAHRLADQDNFELDRGSSGELLGAKKVDARGTDIARDESDGRIFARAIDGAQAQRKIERGAGILAVLGKDTYGMRWNAGKTTGLRRNEERLQPQCGSAVQLRKRLRHGSARPSLDVRFGWPLFQWSYAI